VSCFGALARDLDEMGAVVVVGAVGAHVQVQILVKPEGPQFDLCRWPGVAGEDGLDHVLAFGKGAERVGSARQGAPSAAHLVLAGRVQALVAVDARNPCRIRGAGEERAAERPVLIVDQVFELADQVGRRPIGNIRKLPAGGYRPRFARYGVMRTASEIYRTRADAVYALEKMADEGRVDVDYDRRFRALVLLSTFASLRWGEATALRRCDVDLESGLVRVRAAFSDSRSPGSKITLGPLKSRAARRTVGIPEVILPALREHVAIFVSPGADSLMFPGAKGGAVAPQ
jgi:hypothetical protein